MVRGARPPRRRRPRDQGRLAGLAAQGSRRANIAAAVEESLRRLQTDRIDLYCAHNDDPDTPQEETLAAFDALVRAGKVRAIGASNFTRRAAGARRWRSRAREGLAAYVALQPHYNLVERAEFEAPLLPVLAEHGLSCVPYFGLARGFLTGKYRPGAAVDSPRAEGARSYLDDRGLRGARRAGRGRGRARRAGGGRRAGLARRAADGGRADRQRADGRAARRAAARRSSSSWRRRGGRAVGGSRR